MRVIKLGGSLLSCPDLNQRLQQYLAELQPSLPNLILVGGGSVVEAVRTYDRQWHLDEAGCHWLCVRLMDSTADLLQLLFPDWPLIECAESLAGLSQQPDFGTAIVAPKAFYSPKLNADALPLTWQTTGDSISLLLAKLVQAQELILLKSAGPAEENGEPLIDANFFRLLPADLRWSVVNLRQWNASSNTNLTGVQIKASGTPPGKHLE